MLLAFDVGNTNIVCGVYKDRKLIRHWRVATDTLQTLRGSLEEGFHGDPDARCDSTAQIVALGV